MAADLDLILLQLTSTKPQEKRKAIAAIEKEAVTEAAPALTNLLAAEKDESLRAAAAKTLGTLEYAPAEDILLSAMQNGSDEVSYFAANALAAINPDGGALKIYSLMKEDEKLSEKAFYWYAQTLSAMGENSYSYLVSLLEIKSWTKRKIIGDLLTGSGEKAAPFLINGIYDKNIDRRFWCASILGKIGAKEAVDTLIKFVDDENNDVRTAVITALGDIGSKQAIEALKKNLKNPKKEIRHKAIEILGRFGDEIIESLIESLSDDYWYVRDCACRALAKLGKKAVPYLAKAYRSGNEDIRISSIKALYESGIDSIEVLITALSDNYEPVCKKAADAIIKIGKPALENLVTVYNRDGISTQVKKWIIHIIGETSVGRLTGAARNIIYKALDSKEITLKYAAVCALKNLRDASTIETLTDLLADIHEEIREKAVENLIHIRQHALEHLIKSLNHENWVVRKNAAYVLGRFGSMAVSELIKLLENGDENSRYWAIKALGQIGAAASEPLLKSIDDPDWQVRKNSADSLSEIGVEVIKPLINQLIKAMPAPESNLFYWSEYTLINTGYDTIPYMGRLIQSDNANLRMLAVGVLGRFNRKREAYQLIKDAIHDENTAVARRAIEFLGAFKETETAELLLDIAEKTLEDDETNLAIINSLSKLEYEPALDYLYRMLKSPRWVIRHKTIAAFYNFNEKYRELIDVDKITQALSDEVTMVAESAAGFLALLKNERAQIAVVRLLKEDKFLYPLLDSLAHNPEFKSKDLIFSYIKHENRKIREKAAVIIGLTGNKNDASKLTALVSDEYICVRAAALHAINLINARHTPHSMDSLFEISTDENNDDEKYDFNEADQFYKTGLHYAKNREIEKALSAYQKAILIDSRHVESYCQIGLILEEKGYYDKAAAFLKKAISISPDFALAHLYLAIVLSMSGRNFDAAAELKKVIKLNGDGELAATGKKNIR